MANRPPPLRECPASPDSLHFATYWYRLPSIPNFFVCTNCYEDKIAKTRFAPAFESFYYDPVPGQAATCMFNNMTVKQIFIAALESNYNDSRALSGLFGHANRRAQVLDCPGTEGARAEQGVRWYGNTQIPDLMVCEACYLDQCCGSTFMTNFSPYPTQQPPDHVWMCDMAIPNVQRHLRQDSDRSDWSAFVNAVSHRIHLPKCDGAERSLTQTNWFTPNAIPNVLICETCYMDEISMTPVMNQFKELRSNWTGPPPPSHITGRCAFAKVSIQVCTNQLLKNGFDRWVQLVRHIRSLPPCDGQTVQDGEFYMLMNPNSRKSTDFGLCESCYVGCVEASNGGRTFHRERVPGLGYCEFSPSNPRMSESIQRLTELLFTGNVDKFIQYATSLQAQSVQQYQPAQQYQQVQQSQPQQQIQTQIPQQTQSSQQQPAKPSGGSMSWQQASAQMAQQHAFSMNMSNMIFSQNQMHNATMSGIANQGSSYNSYYDPSYTSAQYNFNAAQSNLAATMFPAK